LEGSRKADFDRRPLVADKSLTTPPARLDEASSTIDLRRPLCAA